ncbi:lipocalin family protein [Rufibacter aurantiacus]|uniref:lipocalin family protein n=1 Tax=Rufibacter aurantiacus TaxID=2817374 RepID=UPI001B303D62|nr:lipocalin family protein [Rufibacter aurantiacus]
MVLLCVIVAQLQAQTSPSIVGTWEMLSMTGKNENGEPINRDVNVVKQYKVITPTHWMYVVKGIIQDTLRMEGGYGTYTLTGNKYVEKLSDPATTDFTMRVEGDRLFQDGHILLPDGKKVELHEVYRRVSGTPNADKSLVGAWNLVSSYHMAEGKRVDDRPMKEFQLITPTHFMWVERDGDKPRTVAVGSYTYTGGKLQPRFLLAPPMIGEKDKFDITAKVEGDRLVLRGTTTSAANGKAHEWGVTYQRADTKQGKTVAGTK